MNNQSRVTMTVTMVTVTGLSYMTEPEYCECVCTVTVTVTGYLCTHTHAPTSCSTRTHATYRSTPWHMQTGVGTESKKKLFEDSSSPAYHVTEFTANCAGHGHGHGSRDIYFSDATVTVTGYLFQQRILKKTLMMPQVPGFGPTGTAVHAWRIMSGSRSRSRSRYIYFSNTS